MVMSLKARIGGNDTVRCSSEWRTETYVQALWAWFLEPLCPEYTSTKLPGQRPRMTKNTEPNFSADKNQMERQVNEALNALTEIKAYTLKADEIEDFKAAQYALRNLSPEHGEHDLREAIHDV